MVNTDSKYEEILKELITLAQQSGNLPQIDSLVSARQYLLLYRLFARYVKKGSQVLDWGTGIGHFSYYLCRRGYQATGFSMEDFSFKSWLKNYSYKFIKGETGEPTLLPFKDSSFDAVASVGVLEHVREFGGDELSSMKEIRRILRSGGVFICYHLPNRLSVVEYLSQLLKNKFHHQFRFMTSDIKSMAKSSGFRLLETGRYGVLPRNSLGKLPKDLRYSRVLANLWDVLDHILESIFSPFCQNYFFVARKPLDRKLSIIY